MSHASTFPVRLGVVATLVASLGLSACGGKNHHVGAGAETNVPPTVTAITPAAGATGVATNTSLTVTFSEAMTIATIIPANFTVAGLAAGTVVYDAANRVATYTPASPFGLSTIFTATIHTGVNDLAGQPMAADFVWSFTTGASADTTPPTVTATTPASGATGVSMSHKPTATFSESVQALSLSSTTFTLQQGATTVAGTVTYADAGKTAMFAPTALLASTTAYTGTITTAVLDLAGNALVTSYVWTFTTGTTSDTTAPTVSIVSPTAVACGVALNTSVNATFSEAMDLSTITTASFTVTAPGPAAVVGTIAYADLTGIATFQPASALATNTIYTGQLSGIKDLAGNALASAYVWTFTTGMTADTTPPLVTFRVPAAAATGVATNTKCTASFNEPMAPATLTATTFTLSITAGAAVTGTVTYADAGQTAVFVPGASLAASTAYTATVTTGALDLAGNALATSVAWSFTTGTTADTTPPSVTLANPLDLATTVMVSQNVGATFSEPLDPMTISTATFLLDGPGPAAVPGTIAYDASSQIAIFRPSASLAVNTLYTATLTTGVADAAGNAMAASQVWTFTTGSSTGHPPVILCSTSGFAILAGSTISNTGGTIINGDMGLDPGSSITGFPPGAVNGTIHVSNTATAQAKLDLTAAYNDAQGRSTGAISLPGNLGGLTLTPGLYVNGSTSGISGTGSNAILTLDAQGDSTAIFIFQVASTFITDSGTSVVQSGGARAENIYWSVGTSATLGTTSIFYGNILADQSITFATGATLTGRALTRIAAVTLDTNTITRP